MVQSHCSILSHDALHDCLSSNSSLENGERGLGYPGYPFRYCTSCKNTLNILLGERAYSTTGKFKSLLLYIWLCHPANCILVGHGLYTQFNRPFPSFEEVGQTCETTLYTEYVGIAITFLLINNLVNFHVPSSDLN